MLKDAPAYGSFSTNDIAKAKEFYGNTLGLETKDRPEGLTVTLAGGAGLFIYPKPDHVPATFTVLNFMVSNIDAEVDQLTAAGVVFEKYDSEQMKTDAKGIARGDAAHPGPAGIAWFKDPAGNFIAVIQEK